MRTDIAFKTEDGVTLRGWHYLPEGKLGRHPTIVMAPAFSMVKEMGFDRDAEVFAASGLAVLLYDHRNFGASGGEPRQEVDPWQQVRDFRDAVTFAETLPETDNARIGAYGMSMSGGHAIVVGAIDRRVKCVVAQVPFTSGCANMRRNVRADSLAGLRAMFDSDRRARYAGRAGARLPVVSETPAGPAVMPQAQAWEFFTKTAKACAPAWRNEVTLHSLEMTVEYEAGAYIGHVSPTPLLLIVALGDQIVSVDVTLGAYERALEPKKLVTLDGGHFAGHEQEFTKASGAARDWFVQYLLGERGA